MEKLLPLWQALQALSQSETTADIELQAVVNQIQDTMRSDQVTGIADMKLTEESLTTLMESREIDSGRAMGGFGGGSGGNGGGFWGGGGFSGAFPGGGGFGGEISDEDRATRQAQFEQNGFVMIQDRLLTGIVTRLLQDKLGIVSEGAQRANAMNEGFVAEAGAAGLSVHELQAQLAEGQTMAQIVQDNGGDLEALQASLIEIFSELPNADELVLVEAVAQWLGLEQ